MTDPDYPITIRAAAFNGLKILRKYYGLSDDSILSRCGISTFICVNLLAWVSLTFMIVCHPGLKMVYFVHAGWDPEWIAAARKVITTLWIEHYKPADDAANATTQVKNLPVIFNPGS